MARESHAIMDKLEAKHGFEVIKIAVAHPGNEQQSQWLQIRQAKPDYVVLWGWGVMNLTAIKAAAKTGFPARKIGVWWSGAEEDTIPPAPPPRALWPPASTWPAPTTRWSPTSRSMYGKNKGNMEDKTRVGSVYNRGVVHGIITVEAIRKAQEKYGKGKALTGEQVRWGLRTSTSTTPA